MFNKIVANTSYNKTKTSTFGDYALAAVLAPKKLKWIFLITFALLFPKTLATKEAASQLKNTPNNSQHRECSLNSISDNHVSENTSNNVQNILKRLNYKNIASIENKNILDFYPHPDTSTEVETLSLKTSNLLINSVQRNNYIRLCFEQLRIPEDVFDYLIKHANKQTLSKFVCLLLYLDQDYNLLITPNKKLSSSDLEYSNIFSDFEILKLTNKNALFVHFKKIENQSMSLLRKVFTVETSLRTTIASQIIDEIVNENANNYNNKELQIILYCYYSMIFKFHFSFLENLTIINKKYFNNLPVISIDTFPKSNFEISQTALVLGTPLTSLYKIKSFSTDEINSLKNRYPSAHNYLTLAEQIFNSLIEILNSFHFIPSPKLSQEKKLKNIFSESNNWEPPKTITINNETYYLIGETILGSKLIDLKSRERKEILEGALYRAENNKKNNQILFFQLEQALLELTVNILKMYNKDNYQKEGLEFYKKHEEILHKHFPTTFSRQGKSSEELAKHLEDALLKNQEESRVTAENTQTAIEWKLRLESQKKDFWLHVFIMLGGALFTTALAILFFFLKQAQEIKKAQQKIIELQKDIKNTDEVITELTNDINSKKKELRTALKTQADDSEKQQNLKIQIAGLERKKQALEEDKKQFQIQEKKYIKTIKILSTAGTTTLIPDRRSPEKTLNTLANKFFHEPSPKKIILTDTHLWSKEQNALMKAFLKILSNKGIAEFNLLLGKPSTNEPEYVKQAFETNLHHLKNLPYKINITVVETNPKKTHPRVFETETGVLQLDRSLSEIWKKNGAEFNTPEQIVYSYTPKNSEKEFPSNAYLKKLLKQNTPPV